MFKDFRDVIDKQITEMEKSTLYTVDCNADEIWETYLNSFPEGTDLIFRERTQHDCQGCKSFIRRIGSAVNINDDGSYTTIWDVEAPGFYQEVADKMAEFVKKHKIRNVFYDTEKNVGIYHNKDSHSDIVWDHFFHKLDNSLVFSGVVCNSKKSANESAMSVFKGGIEKLTIDAIDSVIELIESKSIYRGEEFLDAVKDFRKLKLQIDAYDTNKDIMMWKYINNPNIRFKNSVIGTLVEDLSSGKDIETAVRLYESKVAPQNYKRSKSLITPKMIEEAEKKINELGFAESLQRRYATLEDISINNVIYANRKATSVMEGSIFDELKKETHQKKPSRAIDVSIEEFLSNTISGAKSIEMFVENKHENNLVSLIAPQQDSKNILKWDNNFSWTYNGDVTDSIKDKVKTAGGKVDGFIRISLGWWNSDDLDLSVVEPNKHTIYYGSKKSPSSGYLDVDMNVGGENPKDPVENICYTNASKMGEGEYKVIVTNFNKRNNKDFGFVVEFETNGVTKSFEYAKELGKSSNILVFTFNYSKEKGITVKEAIKATDSQKEMWGISTQRFHDVSVILNSPNHWDNQNVGNKHYFFMIDECKNTDVVRGLYNEFLCNELTAHRKVLEVLGNKLKVPHSDNQLSGIGISSTKKEEVLFKVDNKLYNVKF